MRNIAKNQRGDTIVEVLIAIAVVSSVLGITYGAMNANLVTMRDNQERTEATKVAQAEIEALKARVESAPGAITAAGGNPFCINIDTSIIHTLISSVPSATPDTEDYTQYVNCRSSFYNYVIKRNAADATQKTYDITVRWEAFNGGFSQVLMSYRIP